MIGVFASTKRPVLFHNNEQYVLNPDHYEIKLFELEEITREKVFSVLKDGHEIINMKYPKVFGIDMDPWSSEEEIDFFFWIYKEYKKVDFYKYYTLSNEEDIYIEY